jgi:A/G-specific adenine glycosylase
MTKDSFEHFDAPRCRSLRQSLLRWYQRGARPLPWRQTRDPYQIWISEIMLQQTTVKAVIPYFQRFLARFPTLQDLAGAEEAEVLQYWEGLGYYSRGRNLRLAAQHVCKEFDGCFPADLVDLQKLPGIGRYTAGAIRSFAFDLPAPIVEANTLRLYSRLLGFDGDPRSASGQSLVWAFAERLQPVRAAGHLNQALMELGATLCTPGKPRCDQCPVHQHCIAFQEGRQHEIPRKPSRPAVTQTVEATIAIRQENRLLVRQRGREERWAGMWDFIRFPIESVNFSDQMTKNQKQRLLKEVATQASGITGWNIVPEEITTEIRHSVTRYQIRLICLVGEVESPDSSDQKINRIRGSASHAKEPDVLRAMPAPDANDRHFRRVQEFPAEASLCWVTFDELAALPMPVTGRKFANLLCCLRESWEPGTSVSSQSEISARRSAHVSIERFDEPPRH